MYRPEELTLRILLRDEPLYAFLDEVVQRDPPGDQLFEVGNASLGDGLDELGVPAVVRLARCVASTLSNYTIYARFGLTGQDSLLRLQRAHIDDRALLPNRDLDNVPLGPHRAQRRIEARLDARAVEDDVRAPPRRAVCLGDDVVRERVEHGRGVELERALAPRRRGLGHADPRRAFCSAPRGQHPVSFGGAGRERTSVLSVIAARSAECVSLRPWGRAAEEGLTGPAPMMSTVLSGLKREIFTACQLTASGSMSAPTSTA